MWTTVAMCALAWMVLATVVALVLGAAIARADGQQCPGPTLATLPGLAVLPHDLVETSQDGTHRGVFGAAAFTDDRSRPSGR